MAQDNTVTPELDSSRPVDVGDSPDASAAVETPQITPSQFEDGPQETTEEVPAATSSLKFAQEAEYLVLPLLGRNLAATHQRRLAIVLAISLLVIAVLTFLTLSRSDMSTQQVAAAGDALTQSQRLAKSITQAVVGSAPAFVEVKESASTLGQSLRALRSGDSAINLSAADASEQAFIEAIWPSLERTEANVKKITDQQQTLTAVGSALSVINRQSSEFLEAAETVASLKLQQKAPATEVLAAGQLVMLTQRIGKSANEFLSTEGVSPEAVFLLGKDLNSFNEIVQALKAGSPELRLAATKDPQTQARLDDLQKIYEQTKTQAGAILGNLQGLVTARQAQAEILEDSDKLRLGLQTLRGQLTDKAGFGILPLTALVLSVLTALTCIAGLAFVQVQASRQRQSVAETQQQRAVAANRENQDAILRLMDELETVADGDLTHQATVSEDITGAIADSVNSTVDELRALVGSVQQAANVVARTTSDVEASSKSLLLATNQQSNEIRNTGQSILEMAERMSQVSAQAQGSAAVAQQSRSAAESGLFAVQNAIGGMNTIRDQIQETSKRIKRLGESSQQIGEITELISDITEQTNVLALNAAIQAASAGEAGRGFSVVAEEVQRLAERSGQATRQIAALVRGIQSDTQDAVKAMERSTEGVVEGARLSDNAGAALTEIDQVSKRLADLIEKISNSTSHEAQAAQAVAQSIQRILAVTERTSAGTQFNAEQVRQLAAMALDLGQSVSRFKIN
jgi:twitching motility protein PilJ